MRPGHATRLQGTRKLLKCWMSISEAWSDIVKQEDRDEVIRQIAYAKWEAEGKPDGQHERHWQEAEQETPQDPPLPQTSTPGEDGHIR